MRTAIVVIGRNEGARLRTSLPSALRQCTHVVYVDSGSNDGSPFLARSLGADVVESDSSPPLTAAKARNAGFAFAYLRVEALEVVQFLDGDCELVDGWLDCARGELEKHVHAAAVFGRRREVQPDRSVFSKLCDLEWDGTTGEAKAFGGDVLLWMSAVRAAGGFDESLIAGEEPELSVRIRRRGWKILRIGAEMSPHDAQMTRFSQWWKCSLRAGHAYAEGAWMHGLSPERHWLRESISIPSWGLLLPVIGIASAAVAPPFAFAVALCYPVLGLRIFRRAHGDGLNPADARLYAAACVIAKFPHALGQMQFYSGRLAGRRSRLIEYKPT